MLFKGKHHKKGDFLTDEAVIYTSIGEKAILEDVYVSAVFLKYE